MSNLFSPMKIKSIELKNRIVVSPMCQYSSVDGFANDWHLVHLGSRAVGGAGLIFTEAAAVAPEGRISPEDLGIWKDDHIEKLNQIARFIHAQGSVAGIQLAHAGRKASITRPWEGDRPLPKEAGGWNVVGPSPIPFDVGYPVPHPLTREEIQKVKENFVAAAERSLRAGFKVLEIHAAHGYLFHEFFSPVSNQRTDEYGGNFGNRIRIVLETVEAVKKVWPKELPIFVRISATDWKEGAWEIRDSIELAKQLKKLDVDVIDCSSGGNVPDVKIPAGPLYQAPFAEQIRKESGIATGAVGLITQAGEANTLIEKQGADLVFLAREHLRDPYFALHAAWELKQDMNWPLQYERAKPREHRHHK